MTMENPFLRWLEEAEGRRGFYQSQLGNRPFAQQQFFGNLFPQVENRFLGAQANRMAQGFGPDILWTDWLRQNFNPQREMLRAPAYQTGRTTSQLFSSPRYLYGF